MWLLARLARQWPWITVCACIVSSIISWKSASANNSYGTWIWSAWASNTLNVIRVWSLLVLWLWLYEIWGSTHWEPLASRATWTLTSRPWSLWCISLLVICHELFLLIIHHHLVENLVVSSLLYQRRLHHLRVELTFRKVARGASHLLFSILMWWRIGSHAASRSLNLHYLRCVWVVFLVRYLFSLRLIW